MAEPIEGEAEINVPGTESIELMPDTVEGVGLGQVTDPLSEEQVRGWEWWGAGSETVIDKCSIAARDTGATAAAGSSMALPYVHKTEFDIGVVHMENYQVRTRPERKEGAECLQNSKHFQKTDILRPVAMGDLPGEGRFRGMHRPKVGSKSSLGHIGPDVPNEEW
ncbi:hypothetical protein NDA14_005809 [Ustilago hordei]|nr:hypothetical protein NDA14_005809 [Ustilago hordei]